MEYRKTVVAKSTVAIDGTTRIASVPPSWRESTFPAHGHRISVDIDLFTDADYGSIDFEHVE